MKKDATLQMPTLLEITNKAIQDGYTENFRVASEGLTNDKAEKFYTPQEVTIANFHRFEGYSSPEDSAVVYFIETNDGLKGLLIDAYGAYADENQSDFIREVEGSLARLQTDYIDLYQVHGWDSNTPLEETLRTLDDLVRQGKVRYIGLSNLMSWQAATALMMQERLGLERYVTAQMYYSLVGRGLEHEFQSFAEYHDVGILVWSPLAGGFLAGKYSRDNPPPAGSRFADAGQFVPFDREMGYRVVDALKEVAAQDGASPAQVAISWVLSRPAVSSVIVAARKAEQLEDNILAADLRLSDDDVRQLDAASDPGIPYPKWMVLQLDTAEDPRSKILHPERYAEGAPWKDLRGTRWSG